MTASIVPKVTAILVLILGRHHMQGFVVIGHYALWVATIAAIVSGIDYSRRFNDILAGRVRPEPEARERQAEGARKHVSA